VAGHASVGTAAQDTATTMKHHVAFSPAAVAEASAQAFTSASGPSLANQRGSSFQGRIFLSKGQPVNTALMGGHFWKRFGESIHVLCLGELKHALMAHSVVGAPGAITLLSNLVTSADFGTEAMWKVRAGICASLGADGHGLVGVMFVLVLVG